jgi:hypothetical protein
MRRKFHQDSKKSTFAILRISYDLLCNFKVPAKSSQNSPRSTIHMTQALQKTPWTCFSFTRGSFSFLTAESMGGRQRPLGRGRFRPARLAGSGELQCRGLPGPGALAEGCCSARRQPKHLSHGCRRLQRSLFRRHREAGDRAA